MQTKTEWNEAAYILMDGTAPLPVIRVKGRVRWALENLIEAGPKGCTPINNPAPRWAAYVHKLRRAGVNVETLTEPHAGAFAGTHARYVLRDAVVAAK